MSQLNQNRWDQLLRRVGDLKGPGSKVNDALTELFPTLDVENVPAELLLLGGSRICMGTVALTAGGVGNFCQAFLRVNAGTGVVARLIAVAVFTGTDTQVRLGPTQNSLAATGVRAFTDGRVFGQGTAAVIQGANNNLAAGSLFFRLSAQAVGGGFLHIPAGFAVITPGNAFSVGNTNANETLQASFIWVERVALPSELNL